MLKKLIVVSGQNQLQCNNEQDVIRGLISQDYYQLSSTQKEEKMKLMATANLINRPNVKIINKDNIKDIDDVENKFVLLDEKTYVLSLLSLENSDTILLERKDSDVYTGLLDKSKFTKNYILVNKFANVILKEYVRNYNKRKIGIDEEQR